jgi:hypothetical protein
LLIIAGYEFKKWVAVNVIIHCISGVVDDKNKETTKN